MLKDHRYVTGGNEAIAIDDGVVKEIKQKDGKYTLTIQQDNGVMVKYGDLQHVAVKAKERIMKNMTIASFETSLTLHFFQNDKEIAYDEALKQ